jgi:MscS family membrane protein
METLELGALLTRIGITDRSWHGVIEIFLVVLLTAAASFAVGKAFARIEQQFSRTANLWDDNLLYAARAPVSAAIWLIGLSWAAHVAKYFGSTDIFDIVAPLQRVGVIFCLAWFVVRFISGGERILVSAEKMKQPMDQTTVSAIGKLLRASVIITAVLVVLQSMGYSISGVLAFGGIGGIAVGFAAKDLLANFFGGLMIYLDRPFKVGDWILSPDQEIEGTVEHIGWRLTTIRTFDKRPLYVPNSVFTSISVQNPSRMTHRRIHETIGIRYDDAAQMATIVQRTRTMLEQHPEIDATQTLIVNFDAFAASSLDFFIYTFTRTTNWVKYHQVKQDVLLKVLEIVAEAGAEVAFPTSTLHLASLPGPDPMTQGAQRS